ncbi:MAG: hypothetical protein AABW47_02130 [Nanoarchaeota archaeon]
MKIESGLSYLFIFVSFIFILNLPINLTGHVINPTFTSGNVFFGILFLVFGIVLLLIHEEGGLENLAERIRKSGRVVDKPRDLLHIAREMKYVLKDPVKEGIPVYDLSGKNCITIIPLHKVTGITSRDIMRDLAKGKSSLNRRNYSYR